MPISREQLGFSQVEVPSAPEDNVVVEKTSVENNHVDTSLKDFFKKGSEVVLPPTEAAKIDAAVIDDQAEVRVDGEELPEKINGEVQAPDNVEIVAGPGQEQLQQAEVTQQNEEDQTLDNSELKEQPLVSEPETKLPAWETLTDNLEVEDKPDADAEKLTDLEKVRQLRADLINNQQIRNLDRKLLQINQRLSKLEEIA